MMMQTRGTGRSLPLLNDDTKKHQDYVSLGEVPALIESSPVVHHYERIVKGQIFTDKEQQLKKSMMASRAALHKMQRMRWPSRGVVCIAFVVALVGLAYGGTVYTAGSSDTVIPELYCEDVIHLFIVLPALLLAHRYTMRGSVRAFVLWMAGLAFLLYNYLVYAFETNYSALFPAYLLLITMASFIIFGVVGTLDPRALKPHFQPWCPTGSVAALLMAFAAAKLGCWIWLYLALLQGDGTIPVERSAFILDLSFVVPVCVLVAIMCWRRQSWGLLLGGVCLSDAALMSGSAAAKTAASLLAPAVAGPGVGDGPRAWAGAAPQVIALYAALCLLGALLLGAYLRAVEPHLAKSHRFVDLGDATLGSQAGSVQEGLTHMNVHHPQAASGGGRWGGGGGGGRGSRLGSAAESLESSQNGSAAQLPPAAGGGGGAARGYVSLQQVTVRDTIDQTELGSPLSYRRESDTFYNNQHNTITGSRSSSSNGKPPPSSISNNTRDKKGNSKKHSSNIGNKPRWNHSNSSAINNIAKSRTSSGHSSFHPVY